MECALAGWGRGYEKEVKGRGRSFSVSGAAVPIQTSGTGGKNEATMGVPGVETCLCGAENMNSVFFRNMFSSGNISFAKSENF